MKKRYGASETALSRHETWKRGFERSTLMNLIMIVIVLISVSAGTVAIFFKPSPLYFAAREDGGILPLTPVKEPFLTDNQVLNFATEGITRALSFDFASYRQDLMDSAKYFSQPAGWAAFNNALNSSGTLQYVISNKIITSATANGGMIVNRGAGSDGIYHWVIQIPVIITYLSASEKADNKLLIELDVIRVPTWTNSRGVAIRQVNMRRA